MATRALSATLSGTLANGIYLAVWTGLLNGDDGAPIQVPWFGDKSIHFKGTFGVGGKGQIQGSNDGVSTPVYTGITACLLRDPGGVVIAITSNEGMNQILEVTNWIRPLVTAGDGTTSLSAYLLCRPPGRAF